MKLELIGNTKVYRQQNEHAKEKLSAEKESKKKTSHVKIFRKIKTKMENLPSLKKYKFNFKILKNKK